MKKIYFIASIVILALLNGCTSVYYLDRLDRIPHEKHKGYVKFISEYETDNEKDFLYHPNHAAKKIEHGYEVSIINFGISGAIKPITDRPGSHRYIIQYPVSVAVRIENGLAEKTQAEKDKLKPYEITEKIFHMSGIPNMVWTGSSETDGKEVQISIAENMVTPIGIKSFFTCSEERRLVIKDEKDNTIRENGDSVKIFDGTIEIKTGTPFEISTVQEDDINFSGPRIYEIDRKKVFEMAMEAAKALKWRIKQGTEKEGCFDIEIHRMPGNNIAFTVMVYQTEQGKTGVDLSSKCNWQGWGSFNMNLCRNKIYEFYNALDDIVMKIQ